MQTMVLCSFKNHTYQFQILIKEVILHKLKKKISPVLATFRSMQFEGTENKFYEAGMCSFALELLAAIKYNA